MQKRQLQKCLHLKSRLSTKTNKNRSLQGYSRIKQEALRITTRNYRVSKVIYWSQCRSLGTLLQRWGGVQIRCLKILSVVPRIKISVTRVSRSIKRLKTRVTRTSKARVANWFRVTSSEKMHFCCKVCHKTATSARQNLSQKSSLIRWPKLSLHLLTLRQEIIKNSLYLKNTTIKRRESSKSWVLHKLCRKKRFREIWLGTVIRCHLQIGSSLCRTLPVVKFKLTAVSHLPNRAWLAGSCTPKGRSMIAAG